MEFKMKVRRDGNYPKAGEYGIIELGVKR